MTRVRAVQREDIAEWMLMRQALWPEDSVAAHRAEIDEMLGGDSRFAEQESILAEGPAQEIIGFAEVSVRPYAEGCTSPRVAYLEGWFVQEGQRGRGVGRALIEAAEAWGRAQGCSEFASDADPDNTVSLHAHGALGFQDMGLVRCFRKEL